MSRRASTFDRLALREKVLINRQMHGLGELNNEFQKIDQMRKKLDEMAREQIPNEGEQAAGTFRVTAQLNQQIRKQLETASNRCDYLARELQDIRKKIALSSRRRKKSAGRAHELRANERNERMRKQEDDDASRRRNRRA